MVLYKRTIGVCRLLCGLALGAPVGAGADIDDARRLDISGWEGRIPEAMENAQNIKYQKGN